VTAICSVFYNVSIETLPPPLPQQQQRNHTNHTHTNHAHTSFTAEMIHTTHTLFPPYGYMIFPTFSRP
jgi:hypothetical protein